MTRSEVSTAKKPYLMTISARVIITTLCTTVIRVGKSQWATWVENVLLYRKIVIPRHGDRRFDSWMMSVIACR